MYFQVASACRIHVWESTRGKMIRAPVRLLTSYTFRHLYLYFIVWIKFYYCPCRVNISLHHIRYQTHQCNILTIFFVMTGDMPNVQTYIWYRHCIIAGFVRDDVIPWPQFPSNIRVQALSQSATGHRVWPVVLPLLLSIYVIQVCCNRAVDTYVVVRKAINIA